MASLLARKIEPIKTLEKISDNRISIVLVAFNFLVTTSIRDNLFFLTMIVFGSGGIRQVAESTKSRAACAFLFDYLNHDVQCSN